MAMDFHYIFFLNRLTQGNGNLGLCNNIRQFNNIDFSSEVSTVHKFRYTDEALLLVRQ